MKQSNKKWNILSVFVLFTCLGTGSTSVFAQEEISDKWVKDELENAVIDKKNQEIEKFTFDNNLTGWQKKNNQWVYVQDNGELSKNNRFNIEGKYYFFDIDGYLQKGWVAWNNEVYFADSAGIMKTNWLNYDGNWYYFGDDGVLKKGWVKDGSQFYYLDDDGQMVTGWKKDSGKWYYLDSSGAMKKGWLNKDGNWYYLDRDGSMMTDVWIQPTENGDKFYLNADGIWTNASYSDPEQAMTQSGILVGQFQETPYNFLNQGFLVKRDNLFGIIKTDGNWLILPSNKYANIIPDSGIGFLKDDYSQQYLIVNTKGEVVTGGFGVGGVRIHVPVITVNGDIEFYDLAEKSLAPIDSKELNRRKESGEAYVVHKLTKSQKIDETTYYLWCPKTEQVFGPYLTTDNLPNAYNGKSYNDPCQITVLNFEFGSYYGLFYTREPDGTYTIHSPITKTSIGGFTKVTFPGIDVALGWKDDGSFTVYDLNLNSVYNSGLIPGVQLQNGTGLVNGTALVQYANKWYAVKVR